MPKLTEIVFLEKRQHILMCARQVFAQRGYEAATIKDLLTACGISNGALFVYFKSKRRRYSISKIKLRLKIFFDILSVVCCQLPLSKSKKASTFES